MLIERKPKVDSIDSMVITKAEIKDNGNGNQFLTIHGTDKKNVPMAVSVFIGLDSIKEMYYTQIFCQLGFYGNVDESKICELIQDKELKVKTCRKEVEDVLTKEKVERIQYSFDID